MLEEKNSGNKKGKQILESIVRALIKLIPVAGESIDQATFGSKDAIEDAELHEMVQVIYKIVTEIYQRDLPNTNLKLETILEEIILMPRIQDIQLELNNISEETLDRLIGLIVQLQVDVAENNEVIESFTESINHVQDLQNRAIKEAQESRTSQKEFENQLFERLEKLETKLEQLTMSKSPLPSRDLKDISRELEHIEVDYLVDTSMNLVIASNLIQSNYEFEWAVDFSELHGYARAPFSDYKTLRKTDLYAGFRVYLFKSSDSPLYILPPTEIEIRQFLESTKLSFMNRLNANQVLFLRRLREILYHSNIKRWVITSNTKYDLNYTPLAYEYFQRFRPLAVNINSSFIDAHVASFINEHNNKQDNNRLGFITSSTTFLHVIQRMIELDVYQGLYISSQSIVINPYIYTVLLYVKSNQQRLKSLLDCTAHAEITTKIKKKFSDIRLWLSKPTINSLEMVMLEIQHIRDSLIDVSKVTRPFHEEVIDAQLKDYKDLLQNNSTQYFKQTFDKALSESLSITTDLVSYLKPIDDALKPFRDFYDGNEQ